MKPYAIECAAERPMFIRRNSDGTVSWTADPDKALRFETKIAAATFAERQMGVSVNITEL